MNRVSSSKIGTVRRVLAGVKDWRGSLSQLRWQTVRVLAPRRIVWSRGLRLTLQCENWITQYRWHTFNEKEPETLDWIDRRVRDGDTVFDIGANLGVYTIYAALRHPRIRVVAFEPEYANLHLLRDNIIENHVQERVEVYGVALSDRSGISRLHLQDIAPGSALHTESNTRLDCTASGRPVVWREGICTLTLDEFCDQAALHPQAIKLDVDGTEPRVLAGAARTLGSPQLRSLMLEMPDDAAARCACEQQLNTAGLRRQWHDPTGKCSNEVWERASDGRTEGGNA